MFNKANFYVIILCVLVPYLLNWARTRDAADHPAAPLLPFIESELDAIERHIKRWEGLPPWGSEERPTVPGDQIDFVFYWSKGLTSASTALMSRVKQLQSLVSASGAFDNVYFYGANLLPSEDQYPIGASLMFFRLFHHRRIGGVYDVIFLMESDCHICQGNWLRALTSRARTASGVGAAGEHIVEQYAHASSPSAAWWMMGTITRTGDELLSTYTFADHLNGNALYHVGDKDFANFIARLEADFLEDPAKYVHCYDIALYNFRRDRSVFSFKEYGDTLHKFVYTNLVQNYFRTEVSAEQVCRESPETYFVHGRNVIV